MKLIKAIGGLAAANALSQLLQFLAQPLLARFYTPIHFGQIAEVVALANILAVIGTLQIHNYLVIEKNNQKSQHLVRLGGTLAFFAGATTLLFLYLTLTFTTTLDMSGAALISTSVLVLTYCHANIIRGLFTANSSFKILAVYSLTRSGIIVFSQLVLAKFSQENGLLIGLLCGEILAQVALLASRKTCTIFHVLVDGFFTDLIKLVRSRPVFFLAGTAGEIVASAAFSLPLILIVQLYGHSAGGQFSLAHRMTWAPFLLLTQSIAPVLYRHLASLTSKDLTANTLLRITPSLFLFLIGGAFSFLASQWLFSKLFDATWNEAMEMTGWVALWGISFCTAFPYRICYRTLSRQHVQLALDALIIVAILLISYSPPTSATTFVQFVCIVGVIQNWALIFMMRAHLNRIIR